MQVRAALFEQDAEALRRMAEELDLTTIPADTAWVLLTAVNDVAQAVEVTKLGLNYAWEYYVPKSMQMHTGN